MDRLGSPSLPPIEIDSIMKKSQTRVWKALNGEPEFIISVSETQNILDKFASSKIDLVILHVDLVGSTKLSMTLSLDRLRMMIQSFNQEMSLIVKEFGGFVLKYVGDAVLAFFVVGSGHQSERKVICARAINCAICMLQVAQRGINPILSQYECPQMKIRIGIDMGENVIIQSGWDIHQRLTGMEKDENDAVNNRTSSILKKPVYDILGYTTSLAVKMTALANPNHMVIGELVYEALEDGQKSTYKQLNVSSEVWNYVSSNTGNTGENVYSVYTNK